VLWTIVVVLGILWLLGFSFHVAVGDTCTRDRGAAR